MQLHNDINNKLIIKEFRRLFERHILSLNFSVEIKDIIANLVEFENSKNQIPIIIDTLGIGKNISEMRRLIERSSYSLNLSVEMKEMIENLLTNDAVAKQIGEIFERFDPKFDRIYVDQYEKTYLPENEEPELDQFRKENFKFEIYSGFKYYNPIGWRRYSLKIDNFDEKYKDWPVAYHGTNSDNLVPILGDCLRPSTARNGKHCVVYGEGYYLSPSIEYCGHRRFATPKFLVKRNLYIQTVLQCRVKPGSFYIKREAMLRDTSKKIDPHFKNDEIEWLIPLNEIKRYTDKYEDFLVVYGIMVRITKQDPANLEINQWWNW